jgi:hypothetical protein
MRKTRGKNILHSVVNRLSKMLYGAYIFFFNHLTNTSGPQWQNDESFHLFVTFLSPFPVEGDRFWSPKGDEKFTHSVKKKVTFLSQIFVITSHAIGGSSEVILF